MVFRVLLWCLEVAPHERRRTHLDSGNLLTFRKNDLDFPETIDQDRRS